MNAVYLHTWNGMAALGILALGLVTPAQAQKQVSRSFAMPMKVDVMMSMTGCQNSPGPQITMEGTMEGAMSLDTGMKGRFIFRNNDSPVGGPHSTTRTVDVTLAPAGASMRFPKQPVLGGVGGNPWIYAEFLQGDGTPIGSEALLGRCVQLAPGN